VLVALAILRFMTQWCESNLAKFFKYYIYNASFYSPKRVTISLPKIVDAVIRVIKRLSKASMIPSFSGPSSVFSWNLVVFLRRVKNDRFKFIYLLSQAMSCALYHCFASIQIARRPICRY